MELWISDVHQVHVNKASEAHRELVSTSETVPHLKKKNKKQSSTSSMWKIGISMCKPLLLFSWRGVQLGLVVRFFFIQWPSVPDTEMRITISAEFCYAFPAVYIIS